MALQFVGSEMTNDTRMPAAAVPEKKFAGRLMVQAQQAAKNRFGGMASIKNKGAIIERTPLTPWETYAQALLLSNEAAYVN